jgi:hypothetical protein
MTLLLVFATRKGNFTLEGCVQYIIAPTLLLQLGNQKKANDESYIIHLSGASRINQSILLPSKYISFHCFFYCFVIKYVINESKFVWQDIRNV